MCVWFDIESDGEELLEQIDGDRGRTLQVAFWRVRILDWMVIRRRKTLISTHFCACVCVFAKENKSDYDLFDALRVANLRQSTIYIVQNTFIYLYNRDVRWIGMENIDVLMSYVSLYSMDKLMSS